MVALIQDNLQAIQDVCKKHHVKALYLIGSATQQEKFSASSDIDFLYEIDIERFKNWDMGDYDYVDNLTDMENSLMKILNKKIDLIPYKNIHNSYFKKNVDQSRQIIYG